MHDEPIRSRCAPGAATIAVFAATGECGAAVVRAILGDPERRFRARAVTRHPHAPTARALADAGAEIVVADLDVAASVRRALQGARAAYCATGYAEHRSPARELARARTLADAAADACVAHVVRPTAPDTRTFVRPGEAMPALHGRYNVPAFDAKAEASRCFVERGVPTTLLYVPPAWEDLARPGVHLRRDASGALSFVFPAGDARLPGIAAADAGRCAFAILARGDALAGKAIGVAGEHLSGAEIAAHLAGALGEPVVHASPPRDVFAESAFEGADELANLFAWAQVFEHACRAAYSVSCARELHPGTLRFATWLAANRDRFVCDPALEAAR